MPAFGGRADIAQCPLFRQKQTSPNAVVTIMRWVTGLSAAHRARFHGGDSDARLTT
jgi:hypothetical protein